MTILLGKEIKLALHRTQQQNRNAIHEAQKIINESLCDPCKQNAVFYNMKLMASSVAEGF
jgi:hypothetical protein